MASSTTEKVYASSHSSFFNPISPPPFRRQFSKTPPRKIQLIFPEQPTKPFDTVPRTCQKKPKIKKKDRKKPSKVNIPASFMNRISKQEQCQVCQGKRYGKLMCKQCDRKCCVLCMEDDLCDVCYKQKEEKEKEDEKEKSSNECDLCSNIRTDNCYRCNRNCCPKCTFTSEYGDLLCELCYDDEMESEIELVKQNQDQGKVVSVCEKCELCSNDRHGYDEPCDECQRKMCVMCLFEVNGLLLCSDCNDSFYGY